MGRRRHSGVRPKFVDAAKTGGPAGEHAGRTRSNLGFHVLFSCGPSQRWNEIRNSNSAKMAAFDLLIPSDVLTVSVSQSDVRLA